MGGDWGWGRWGRYLRKGKACRELVQEVKGVVLFFLSLNVDVWIKEWRFFLGG